MKRYGTKIAERLLVMAMLLAVASCGVSRIIDDRFEAEGTYFSGSVMDRGFEYEARIVINHPAWKIWNAATDPRVYGELLGAEVISLGDEVGACRVGTEARINTPWYAPDMDTVQDVCFQPQHLQTQQTCTGGDLAKCYINARIEPYGDGSQSLLVSKGYFGAPLWWTPTKLMLEHSHDKFRDMAKLLDLYGGDPRFEAQDARYPWRTFTHLAVGGSVTDGTTTSSRAKVTIQGIRPYADTETATIISTLATRFLADTVRRSTQLKITTNEDVELMAKYLGENWALVCDDSDQCQKRIAGMVQADYVLTGNMMRADNRFHLQLSMFHPARSEVIWGFQRSVTADLSEVRIALQDATKEIRNLALVSASDAGDRRTR